MRRPAVVLIAIAWTAVAGSLPTDGETLFRECEFKAAARTFAHALGDDPRNARLHFWARQVLRANGRGLRSFTARRNARKAQAHLETAVQLDPSSREFLMELFERYVDSPEYFDGGLNRATVLLERFGLDDGGPGTPSRIVAEARKQYNGPAWAMEKCILRISGAAGYLTRRRR